MQIETTTLANGLRTANVALPHSRRAAVAVAIDAGSRCDPDHQPGIGHFLEHMAFKDGDGRETHEISRRLERLGAELNAYTAKDRTVFHVSGLAEHLPVFVELLATLVCPRDISEAELENERAVIVQEIRRARDNPSRMTRQLLDTVCYAGHPYGHSVGGDTQVVSALQSRDLNAHLRQHYVGTRTAIGITGPGDAQRAFELVDRHFSGLPRGEARTAAPPAHRSGLRNQEQDLEETRFALSFPIPGLDGDYWASLVAASVLGDGMSSPLFEELREKRGLVYDISCYGMLRDDSGQMIVTGGTRPEHVRTCIEQLLRVMREQARQVGKDDLERAINGLRVSLLQRIEDPLRLAIDCADSLLTAGHVSPLEESLGMLSQTRPQQVQGALEIMLDAKPAISSVGSSDSTRSATYWLD